MADFLARYLHGEHEQVWKDMILLKEEIYSKEYYEDVKAVAQETMRRARYNIEVLIERLPQLGYIFGYSHQKLTDIQVREAIDNDLEFWRLLNPEDPDEMKGIVFHELTEDPNEWISKQARTWVSGSKNSENFISIFEHTLGKIPLSIRYWYSQIEEVNLCGSPPAHWLNSPPKTVNGQYHSLDPLYINGMERILSQALYYSTSSGFNVFLAPYDEFKGGKYIIESGGYYINLPNSHADVIFEEEWHNTTFVDYLRNCFKWGGLPGIEFYAVPQSELNFLTKDLLSM